jgi:hypothetical protein
MLKRTDYAEKRQFGRRQTNIRAWIKVTGRPSIPCTVRDISQGGALLECDEEVWLPYSFRVMAEHGVIDSVCEIRHQNGRKFGVEFVAKLDAFEVPGAYSLEEAATWMGHDRSALRR